MRVLKVMGKGQVAVEPDLVTFSFGVEVENRDYGECVTQLNERADNLKQSMANAGLERTGLKTSDFSIRVKNKYKDGKYYFDGYSASHRMHIRLPVDKQLLNRVLGHLAKGHSGAEISLTFSVADQDGLRKKVLTQAVRVARENATTLAAAAGVKLGQLVQMEHGWSEVHIFDRSAQMICESNDLNPDIEPEDVEAQDNVTLVYEIQE
jgi:uncharacterized protein YggE